jgi:hypothetical protein
MTARSTWRGHSIVFVDGAYQFEDTGGPTVGSDRPCGHCGKYPTIEGHDRCVGTLPGVMNACCGHGEVPLAYVQMPDGSLVQGQDALDVIDKLKTLLDNGTLT